MFRHLVDAQGANGQAVLTVQHHGIRPVHAEGSQGIKARGGEALKAAFLKEMGADDGKVGLGGGAVGWRGLIGDEGWFHWFLGGWVGPAPPKTSQGSYRGTGGGVWLAEVGS